MRLTWRTVWVGLAASSLIGLAFAAQFYLYLSSFGRQISWTQALKWNLGSWYLWAILAPLIMWAVRITTSARNKVRRAIVVHVIFGLTIAAVHTLGYGTWTWLAAPPPDGPQDWSGIVRDSFTRGFSWEVFCYAAIAAAFHAFSAAHREREERIRASRLEAQLAGAQLDALRAQLQPHFLFNTLNTVMALVRDDPSGAEDMITRLSNLLRTSLETAQVQEIPLRKELDFARAYLDIQRVRFGERLQARFDTTDESLDLFVPTFLLQPLVENAVRHGLDSDSGRCNLLIASRIDGRDLCVEVRDSGPGLAGNEGDSVREGVGISNTRARLHRTYGEQARFELKSGSPQGCLVSIRIPIDRKKKCPEEGKRS